MSTIPFSYYLYHIPTKKHYYGIRFAKGSKPEDLWTKYFTSSKLVHELIQQYGTDSFNVEVRKIFSNSKDALLWEHKVLRRLNAANKEDWLNRHNGSNNFRSPITHSNDTRKKISRKLKGKAKTEEWKKSMSESSLKDRQRRRESGWIMPEHSVKQAVETRQARISAGIINPYSSERNSKISESKKGTKRQYMPDGSFIYVRL